jgi:hypothetical protein
MRARIAAAVVLLALWQLLLLARHRLIHAVTAYDARPGEAAAMPLGAGPGMPPSPRVRVLLIDGLAADTAAALPEWTAQCKRGVQLTVDVGFPSVSLPVEVALWTGMTQQQTGIVSNRDDRGLVTPLDARGIPAQVPGSRAVAESHGWIIGSLGFSSVYSGEDAPWAARWKDVARDAVASPARLVFVHALAVDAAGHQHGHDSPEYRAAAADAGATLAMLVAAAPDARWFLLSDHGHLDGPRGGHGGEERAVRQVASCIVGPGVAPARGQLVHVVDVARAIADSVGVKLVADSPARPLPIALEVPLEPDQSLPTLPIATGAIALVILVLGAGGTVWARRWWLWPWWLAIACATLVLVRGEPTLSTPMTYAPAGRAMYLTWLPALALAAVVTWLGLGVTTLARAIVAQLALPFAAAAAALTACGAWPALVGTDVAPVVPRFTAYSSALLLVAAWGAFAVGLGVLARAGYGVVVAKRDGTIEATHEASTRA